MSMETYNRRKAEGKCPRCGKAQTKNKGKACTSCKAKIREYQRKRIMNMPDEKYNELISNRAYASLKRRNYLKENNLCVYCGKNEVHYGSRCEPCRIKYNAQQREAWKEHKLDF